MKLYDQQGQFILEVNPSKEIARGGEGAIFQHPSNKKQVIKVYHQPRPKNSLSFVGEMKGLGSEFVRPLEVFFSSKGQVMGYTMAYVDTGKMHLLSDLGSKSICIREGYDFKFRTQVMLAVRKAVESAHKVQIVLGDLNPYNIFFSKTGTEIYFVDTDSYQTPSKKHSGVMLPDIRDWKNIKVDEKSDAYSFAVLAFQTSTYVHPYKGFHPDYKTIEERVTRNLSVLSGDKNIKIPGFYEKLQNQSVENEFFEIFQNDKRFMVNLDGTQVRKVSAPPVATQFMENDLVIRVISDNVKTFTSCNKRMAFCKNDTPNLWDLYTCVTKGVINHDRTSDTKGGMLVPNDFGWYFIDKNLVLSYEKGQKVSNVRIGLTDTVKIIDNLICIFDADSDSCTVVDPSKPMNTVMGLQLATARSTIFVPSLSFGENVCVQSISGHKWFIRPTMTGLMTTRSTETVVRTPVRAGNTCLFEAAGKIFLANLSTTVAELRDVTAEIDSPRYITSVGDLVFIPSDEKILVYSAKTLHKVAEIQTTVVQSYSVLESCLSGILCQTGDALYLINKN